MLLVMAAAFNLTSSPASAAPLPGGFADASGLHKGNMVQVGGIRAGRVEDIDARPATRSWSPSRSTTASTSAPTAPGLASRCSTCSGRSTSTWSPPGRGQLDGRRPDPGEPHLVGVRHRRRLRRPDHDHRADRHRPARPGANVVSDTVDAAGAGDPGQLRGHRAALPVRRLPRPADPAAARQLARRQQAARRPQRRHRRPDEAQRPGLPRRCARRKQAIHRLLVNARMLADPAARRRRPTTRPRSARRSPQVDDLLEPAQLARRRSSRRP